MIDIHIADVGCTGGLHERWRNSHFRVHAHLFDPLLGEEAEELSVWANVVQAEKIALWDSCGTRPYHVCTKRAVSSLLTPNHTLISHYPDPGRYRVEQIVEIPTRTLDVALGQADIDFLKIDAQGASHQILSAGPAILARAVAVQVEIEFIDVYEREATFAVVHDLMQRSGFELWDLSRVHWRRSQAAVGKGQLAWADALYLKHKEASGRKAEAMLAVCVAFDYFDRALDLVQVAPPERRDMLRRVISIAEQAVPASSWREGDEDD